MSPPIRLGSSRLMICAARTRTAQSLSDSALWSTGSAAAAPYFSSAASTAARAAYVASFTPA